MAFIGNDLATMAHEVFNAAQLMLGDKAAGRVALQMLDRDYTYGELETGAQRIAHYLNAAGACKGDRVLLVSENSFFWVASYLGILRAGLVCVPLPLAIGESEFKYISSTTESHFAFLQTRFIAKGSACLPDIKVVTDREVAAFPDALPFTALMHNARPEAELASIQPDDLAALMFTSGSTGKPRGVTVSHRNIIANTKSIVEYLELNENDRIMTVLPFHYCFGTSLLHTHLAVGGRLVVDNRFLYPEKVLDRMQAAECTGFAGVPSHYQILLRKSSLKRRQFPHLRYVQQAGGHLAPSFIQELREALPSSKIFVMYGQTEATARLSYVPPERLDDKLGSIGKAIPDVKLRVVSESGTEVSPGQIGEIVAEGDNVTQGYWRDPEESAKCFRDGKLYTGDLATTDNEGFIYVVDRAKDFI